MRGLKVKHIAVTAYIINVFDTVFAKAIQTGKPLLSTSFISLNYLLIMRSKSLSVYDAKCPAMAGSTLYQPTPAVRFVY